MQKLAQLSFDGDIQALAEVTLTLIGMLKNLHVLTDDDLKELVLRTTGLHLKDMSWI